MNLSGLQVNNSDWQEVAKSKNDLLQRGIFSQIDGTTQPTQANGADILQVAI